MRAVDKFAIFWWGLCCAVVTVYATFDGWTVPHAIGAILYGALFVFEYVRHRGKREATPKRQVDPSAWEPMFGRPVTDWYRVWAWKPVHTLDRGYIWLRPYWRRRVYKKQHLSGGADFWWQNLVELTYVGI